MRESKVKQVNSSCRCIGAVDERKHSCGARVCVWRAGRVQCRLEHASSRRARRRHRPRLLWPAQLSQRRCLSISSFAWCSCEQRLTILQSAFCGCCMREGDVQLMKTRGNHSTCRRFTYTLVLTGYPWVASVIQKSGHNTISVSLVINLHCGRVKSMIA